jgi:hypothetical protein
MFEARWQNALRIARRVNQYIDDGYLVFDETNTKLESKFVITDDSISLVHKMENCTITQEYFEKNKERDHGMWTEISKYNEQFKDWVVIAPEHFKLLLKKET